MSLYARQHRLEDNIKNPGKYIKTCDICGEACEETYEYTGWTEANQEPDQVCDICITEDADPWNWDEIENDYE